ncbi:MAG: AMP-dependent synthetase and ligase [Nocardia sp.]|uniref:class I adenylate-forming enzyme family protein n=1 Tax=Nocardia sp. TaxID=1821 RepID=UPI002611B495|nr:class I adenylate-forming enzyme family protein [Nocardia sp.]MCU1644402.1 AMP-dependent synthetase and ligase [Nocardia sp.]
MPFLLVLVALLLVYLLFIALRIGIFERLWLALRPISIERIPDRAARRYGDRVLFSSDEPCHWSVPVLGPPGRTEWSANDIRETVGVVAAMLRQRLGLQHGDRIAIMKTNHLDIHLLHTGVVRAGGVACTINDGFLSEKLNPYLVNVGARALITDTATLDRLTTQGAGFGDVEHIVLTDAQSGDPERTVSGHTVHRIGDLLAGLSAALATPRGGLEPLYLVHSSGTTGFPKAVILRNGPQSHAIRGWLSYVHISRRRDRGLFALPNNHQAVILSFNSLLLAGVRIHWTREYSRGGLDAAGLIEQLAVGRYTGFFAFPIVYTQLKEVPLDQYDLRAMRFWGSTADATHEAIIRRFVQHGSVFRGLGIPLGGSVYLDAQGSSEVGTPSVLRYYSRFTRRYDRRIGRRRSTPFGPKVRIATNGRPVKGDSVGRLEVRGRTLFEAYWNNHALTYDAIRDGWFFTGDVARWSGDGHVVQLDREVDVIHTRDGDVYSLLIEERVHKHVAVFDACVYGARQADGTQRPAAVIAPRDGFDLDAPTLQDELNQMLPTSMHLARLDIVAWAEFPVGVTGKTLKRVCRERTEPTTIPEANRPIIMREPAQPHAPALAEQAK